MQIKTSGDLETLQKDLDGWLHQYNTERTHQGMMRCGRSPMEILEDRRKIWQGKFEDQTSTDSRPIKPVTVRSSADFYT